MGTNYNKKFKVSSIREANMFLSNIYKVYRLNFHPDDSISDYGETITKIDGNIITIDEEFINWFNGNMAKCEELLGDNIYDVCRKYHEEASNLSHETINITNKMQTVYSAYCELVDSWDDELNDHYPTHVLGDVSFDELEMSSWAKQSDLTFHEATTPQAALLKFSVALSDLSTSVSNLPPEEFDYVNLTILVPNYPFVYELESVSVACKNWYHETYS